MGGVKILYALMLLAMISVVQAACTDVSCGTKACPASYCSGNTLYRYPSTCVNPCLNGTICGSCTCTATATSCGTTACPANYCSGNNKCNYSSTCTNTCSGGSCKTCTCTSTCTACPSGKTCSAGACVSSGGGSPLLRKCGPDGCYMEPGDQVPVSDTWTFAIVILAILGLCIGYFILKEALSISVTRPAKKRKGR
ncbi:hypothetical protein H0N99_03625 [Candidatus Micrarchaeota archaeon]|nr:hypothetical protein [Candidatus Micrarchaeota archaeon]